MVGVDISPQMIALARQQEEAQPPGIEYRVADAATLGDIGPFDRISAAYLLHYAESREQLNRMARTVYDNLAPGQHFVARSSISTGGPGKCTRRRSGRRDSARGRSSLS